MGATPRPRRRSAIVFARNPYYHRIDEKGQQLPYVDRVIFTLAATNLVPAKAGLGEADLQPRYLNMRDYTFLQKSAKSSGVEVRLWESGSGSQLALYPNLNANDEEWRKLMRDVRFRRALSLAIDRDELNEVVYLGLAKPSNNTIMERSQLFKPEYADQVGEVRSQARQQAARRGRPDQARTARASACCPTAGRRPSWSSMPARRPRTPTRCT